MWKENIILFSSDKPTFAHTFYFWVSLIYLIGRTLAVSLYSASINDESKKPLEIFRAVSRQDWCVDVKRFNEEVANDTIALSGMKFFNLTRTLVLSVAGTIVTYELVLIQFHQKDTISDYDPCLRYTIEKLRFKTPLKPVQVFLKFHSTFSIKWITIISITLTLIPHYLYFFSYFLSRNETARNLVYG